MANHKTIDGHLLQPDKIPISRAYEIDLITMQRKELDIK